MFVRELVRTIQDVTKTKPKVSIWTEILGQKKKKIRAIVMVLAGKENRNFNLPKLLLKFGYWG